jgi:chromatin assembly factor 1 subunit B
LASGSVDNCARLWDVSQGLVIQCLWLGKCIQVLSDHSHFVQGLAWDPLNQYLATQSSDRLVLSSSFFIIRTLVIYNLDVNKAGVLQAKSINRSSRLDQSKIQPQRDSENNAQLANQCTESTEKTKAKHMKLYHDEDLTSFFRRCQFSPDGSLFIAPSGQFKQKTETIEEKESFMETAYLYTRGLITK